MRIFAITRRGLISIALLVFGLWGCIASEAMIRHRADSEATAVLRTLRRLKENPVPAAQPAPPHVSATIRLS